MGDEQIPAGLNDEQIKAVQDLVNKAINGTVATLKKQFTTDLSKGLVDSRESIGKMLDEKFSAFKPADETSGGGEGGGKAKGKDLQIASLEKKINESVEAIRTANEKAAKAEARRRSIERNNLVDSTLAKAGVSDPFMRELAIAHFDRRGLVAWSGDDEDSSVIWNGQDGVQERFEEGLSGWIKSDEAKHFLPPRGAAGSGSKQPPRSGKDPVGKQNLTFEDVGNAVLGLVSPIGAAGRIGE